MVRELLERYYHINVIEFEGDDHDCVSEFLTTDIYNKQVLYGYSSAWRIVIDHLETANQGGRDKPTKNLNILLGMGNKNINIPLCV